MHYVNTTEQSSNNKCVTIKALEGTVSCENKKLDKRQEAP